MLHWVSGSLSQIICYCHQLVHIWEQFENLLKIQCSQVCLPSPICFGSLHHRHHLPLYLLQGEQNRPHFFVLVWTCLLFHLLRNRCQSRSAAPSLLLPLPNLTFTHYTFSGQGNFQYIKLHTQHQKFDLHSCWSFYQWPFRFSSIEGLEAKEHSNLCQVGRTSNYSLG